jgi:hypothetical protein
MMPQTPTRTALSLVALCLAATVGISGCATLSTQSPSLVPTRYKRTAGPYVVFSNSAIAADAPPIRVLHALQHDVETTLAVRVQADQPPIEVYILDDRQSFMHFLEVYYPRLPPRRAFFLAQGAQRVVFTFQGDRLEEDLRHEATHALLNVAYGDLPLWLDEGLAEYFEGSEKQGGLNTEHLTRLPRDLATGWRPDLARLETLKNVGEMTPRDYRESWAWVHYLLNGSPHGKIVLQAYLSELHREPTTAPISARLNADEAASPEQLIAHIEQVRAQPVAAKSATDGPTIRLQDNAVDTQTAAPQRRGFFTRVRAFFGL